MPVSSQHSPVRMPASATTKVRKDQGSRQRDNVQLRSQQHDDNPHLPFIAGQRLRVREGLERIQDSEECQFGWASSRRGSPLPEVRPRSPGPQATISGQHPGSWAGARPAMPDSDWLKPVSAGVASKGCPCHRATKNRRATGCLLGCGECVMGGDGQIWQLIKALRGLAMPLAITDPGPTAPGP